MLLLPSPRSKPCTSPRSPHLTQGFQTLPQPRVVNLQEARAEGASLGLLSSSSCFTPPPHCIKLGKHSLPYCKASPCLGLHMPSVPTSTGSGQWFPSHIKPSPQAPHSMHRWARTKGVGSHGRCRPCYHKLPMYGTTLGKMRDQ